MTTRFLLLLGNEAGIILISYLFYHSVIPALIFFPFAFLLYNFEYSNIIDKRRMLLQYQFKDLLSSINSFVSTGYSLENSTKAAYSHLISIYGCDSYICQELTIILNKLHMGTKVEAAYMDFSLRCNIEAINTFSDILNIAKRTSGNISQIVKSTSANIISSLDSHREIYSAVLSKKFERNIMLLMPFFIIVFMNVSSPDFLLPLYVTLFGRIIMTLCLLLYIFSAWLSYRIFNISV